MISYFVSDLHGNIEKYKKLFVQIKTKFPQLVFIGGDLSNHLKRFTDTSIHNFYLDFLQSEFRKLKSDLGNKYPVIFLIMGNDDPKIEEDSLIDGEQEGLWYYLNQKRLEISGYTIYGYSFCPPSPFRLKDWEKYDVSRFVDPGCISPEEGIRTVEIPDNFKKYETIEKDLQKLVSADDLSKSIFLLHTPPYQTNLDRAALDNKKVEGVSVDVHVGSIAVKRFIESKQPMLTLHGHIHESSSITGNWKDKIGETNCFNAAHNGSELSLIEFDLSNLESAKRILL